MASSKSLVVGRRLRRMLGTLLVTGFGVAWWNFIPHYAQAATDDVEQPVPMGPCLRVETPVAINHELPHVPNVVIMPALQIVARTPIAKPRRRPAIKPVIQPVIEQPVIEPPPIVAVVTDPVVQHPVIDLPTIELPPPPDDIEDPPVNPTRKPRIRTRSS